MDIENKKFIELTTIYLINPIKFELDFIEIIQNNINNKNKIDEILENLAKEIYKYNLKNGDKGYIYCLYNVVFKYYGEDVYKLGKSNDVIKRLSGYTTSYLEDSEIKLQSKQLSNYGMAENILFHLLKDYRLKKNREFY